MRFISQGPIVSLVGGGMIKYVYGQMNKTHFLVQTLENAKREFEFKLVVTTLGQQFTAELLCADGSGQNVY